MTLAALLRRLALWRRGSFMGVVIPALISLGLMTLMRAVVDPLLGANTGFAVLYPAVVVAAIWGGRVSGLLTVVGAVIVAWAFVLMHTPALGAAGTANFVNTVIFAVGATFVCWIGAALRDALQRLEERESRFRAVFESPVVGFSIYDLEAGRTVEINDRLLEMVGRTRESFDRGEWDWRDVTAPDGIEVEVKALEKLRAGVALPPLEKTFIRPDGEAVPVALTAAPLRDDPGRVVVVVQEMAERRRAEQALRESEARFRLIADSAPVLLWMGDSEGGGVYLNRAFRDFWGDRTPEQLLGMGWLDAVHDDDREGLRQALIGGVQSREPFRIEARMRRADGQHRLIEATVQPRFGATGEFRGIIGVGFDATESRAAEVALRESEARFRDMADAAPAPIWVSEVDGGIAFVNKAMTDFFELPQDALLGAGWVDRLHPEDLESVQASRSVGRERREPYAYEARFLNGRGQWRWMRASLNPRFDAAGEFQGYVGIAFDITPAREAEEALRTEERRQAFLLQLGDRKRELAEPTDILALVSASLGEHLGVGRVGYGEIDLTETTVSVDSSWSDGRIPAIDGTFALDDFGPELILDLKRGRAAVVPDVLHDARTAEASAAFASIDTRAVLAVPLVKAGRFRAMLFLHHGEPRVWSDADVALCKDVAERTWSAVERARVEKALRESEARFRMIADSAPVLIWVSRLGGVREFVNRAYVDFCGVSYEEATTLDWRDRLHQDDLPRILKEQVAGEASLKPFTLEARYRRADGEWRWLQSRSQPRWGTAGEHIGFVGVGFDVTEAKRAEADLKRINELLEERVAAALADKAAAEATLMHAQKMDAVGRLTGGVAHDFNNLLTVVVGALDMILKHPDDEKRRVRLAEAALSAARRGERLTHQLLAFSRRQALRPEICDANALIRESEPLVRRAVGEAVALTTRLAAGETVIRVDPAQFEAALINMIVNARDATPPGGEITVETGWRELKPGEVLEAEAGRYVFVRVKDTGAGMSPEVMQRVFEPFFTTKPLGKGTGLGLSQVYGFVRQSGGGVAIESKEGEGSSVTLYLPALDAPVAAAPVRPDRLETPNAQPLKVLLVEDETSVAQVVQAMLESLGHTVRRAEQADEALKILRTTARYDVLLTDVIMPGGVDGFELARLAVERRPTLSVLLTSGYAGEALDRALGESPWPFLKKPYSEADLAAAIASAVRRPEPV
jgi:PAS domain S-box-containing protein